MNKLTKFFCLILCALTFITGCSAASSNKGKAGINAGIEGPDSSKKINTQGVKTKWLNIPYASISPAEKLDIYLPKSGKAPFPVIVAIHGGGFVKGDKYTGEVNPELEGLNRGYAVVSINYRLSSQGKWPAQLHDAKAAIRFIRANAGKYNLDPKKIAVFGDSTGGNLAALLGTTGDVKSEEDLSMGNSNESSRVQAVVDWFGPINYLTMDAENKASGIKAKVKSVLVHNSPNSPESKVLGNTITLVPDLVKTTNPENYISSDDPPFLIEHGTLDSKVPVAQSVNFATALSKMLGNNKVTLITFKNAGHGGAEFKTPSNMNRVFDFLDKYLK